MYMFEIMVCTGDNRIASRGRRTSTHTSLLQPELAARPGSHAFPHGAELHRVSLVHHSAQADIHRCACSVKCVVCSASDVLVRSSICVWLALLPSLFLIS